LSVFRSSDHQILEINQSLITTTVYRHLVFQSQSFIQCLLSVCISVSSVKVVSLMHALGSCGGTSESCAALAIFSCSCCVDVSSPSWIARTGASASWRTL